MTFALSAVPVVMAVTGALEFYTISNTRALLQEAVDTGALAGAGKLAIASYDTVSQVTTTATVTAKKNVVAAPDPGAFHFQVLVDEAAGTVTVNGTADHKSLAAITGIGNTTVKATATAEALQKTPLCVLQTSGGGIELAPGVVARELGRPRILVTAAPSRLAGRKLPSHPSELAGWKGIARRSAETGRRRPRRSGDA